MDEISNFGRNKKTPKGARTSTAGRRKNQKWPKGRSQNQNPD